MKRILLFAIGLTLSSYEAVCQAIGTDEVPSFSFAFISDAHVQYSDSSLYFFRKAIDTINALNPDFVISGGDLIRDANAASEQHADSLYDLYLSEITQFGMPVYNAIGNHELFGISKRNKVAPSHPRYGKRMYEERVGKRYYTFEHKGWRFFILDNTKLLEAEGRVVGHIDEEQMDWLAATLSTVDATTPIAVCGHMPFVTSRKLFELGALAATPDFSGTSNSLEFFRLFEGKNLRLVMQGHEHFLEVIYALDKYIVTNNSVSSTWWVKPPATRGFMYFTLTGDSLEWRHVENN
ncbi:metallophosphoesterase family protein [Parapedobacter indicus]|uniref:3',5'-cyclic AMP phosphodiesterase CpdA n=1 Tax=Parapedobacter indicus TaxID=1477437 RepID=A0A1I3KG55_9SPHI|nr:metallophosphoesterase [Parapedobacter indicus]PPL01812.1 3',5'-cyclic AMP phosphodiesterase CpdA [Parapedobacter indicus]SFI71433.1 3',5'-cyclic AMP phosphodiesterase CpdA [Parapedobacter indicus]